MASSNWKNIYRIPHRGRGPSHVPRVENLGFHPINWKAEARQFKFGTYVDRGKY